MVPKDGDEESILDDDDEETDQHKIDRMNEIASFIQEGATAFLMAEYKSSSLATRCCMSARIPVVRVAV